ncbi:MAG: molybdopterin-dependent oxidoreductase [Anaerolineae bacterium]|nr:molybdopterin-dependent oxidoreductase [Anaerolineae bacterium]
MKLHGIGVGSMVYGVGYGFARPDFATAEVEAAADGSLTVWSGASELGQGLRTVLCQIAAQEFGTDYQDVRVVSADSEKTPDSGPVSASRSTYVQGNAVLQACRDLKEELRSLAAEMLKADPSTIEFSGGYVFSTTNPENSIAFHILTGQLHARGRRSHGFGWYDNHTEDVDKETSQGDAYSSFAWASQLAEIELDTETGEVTVLRIASATDVGKAINPKLVEGQIEGGAVQGLGFALLEDMKVERGVFKNSHFSTYILPTAADVPPIDPIIVEVPDPKGPYGAKGMAEPATIPTTPAILNAIADACGKWLKSTPAIPENILHLLGVLPDERKEALSIKDIPYPPF